MAGSCSFDFSRELAKFLCIAEEAFFCTYYNAVLDTTLTLRFPFVTSTVLLARSPIPAQY